MCVIYIKLYVVLTPAHSGVSLLAIYSTHNYIMQPKVAGENRTHHLLTSLPLGLQLGTETNQAIL